jgi:CRISPR type IV-associated protein Csf3
MIETLKELKRRLEQYTPDTDLFKPFKLTFFMKTPISLSHPWMHLDGLLAYLLLRKLLGNNFYTLPSNVPLDFFTLLQLPVKRLKGPEGFIYHASVSQFETDKLYIDKIYKRFDGQHMQYMDPGRSTRIDTTRGRFKNYMIRLSCIPTPTVTFFGHGDIEEIETLVEKLPGLGKKVSEGFGAFHSFEIEVIEQDKSLVNEESKAMRPIPCEFLDERKSYEKIALAYKFPYWAKENVALCCNVNSEIKLKSYEGV